MQIINKITENELKKLTQVINIDHLFIYINTSCNLRCSYCHCAFLNKKLKNIVLDEKKFNKALELFLSFSKNPQFTFQGGEPLLYPQLLKLFILIIKDKSPSSFISVFTNGTLLNEDSVNFFEKNEINLIISIDGDKYTTDMNRKFYNQNSTYNRIIENIKRFKVFERIKNVNANMVVTAENVKDFDKNFFHLEKIGFHSIHWDIDYTSNWNEKTIMIFTEKLNNICKSYIQNKKRSIASNLYDFITSRRKGKDYISLTLLNDGNFYFCDLYVLTRYFYKKSDKLKKFIELLKKEDRTYNELYCGIGVYIYNLMQNKELNFEKNIDILKKLKYIEEKILGFFARKMSNYVNLLDY